MSAQPLIRIVRTQQAIKRAAEILEYDAEMIRESHTLGRNEWRNEEAKQDYDERKKLAKQLRDMIAGAPKQAA